MTNHQQISSLSIHCLKRQVDFHYREHSTGDRGVIQQIFGQSDYDIRTWIQGRALQNYYEHMTRACGTLIVDAGANIGASSLFFLDSYPESIVFAIEPDIANSALLQMNTEEFQNIRRFHGALGPTDGMMELSDPGRSDWGFMTAPSTSSGQGIGTVRAVSPSTILALPQFRALKPLIMKIDIEGAEKYLFDGENAWLGRFPLVIIELHDWMLPFSASAKPFLRAIQEFEFDFLHRGENIFLFNREILSDWAGIQ